MFSKNLFPKAATVECFHPYAELLFVFSINRKLNKLQQKQSTGKVEKKKKKKKKKDHKHSKEKKKRQESSSDETESSAGKGFIIRV